MRRCWRPSSATKLPTPCALPSPSDSQLAMQAPHPTCLLWEQMAVWPASRSGADQAAGLACPACQACPAGPACAQVARHSSEKLTTQLIVTLALNLGLAIAQNYLSRRGGGRQQQMRGCVPPSLPPTRIQNRCRHKAQAQQADARGRAVCVTSDSHRRKHRAQAQQQMRRGVLSASPATATGASTGHRREAQGTSTQAQAQTGADGGWLTVALPLRWREPVPLGCGGWREADLHGQSTHLPSAAAAALWTLTRCAVQGLHAAKGRLRWGRWRGRWPGRPAAEPPGKLGPCACALLACDSPLHDTAAALSPACIGLIKPKAGPAARLVPDCRLHCMSAAPAAAGP